MFCCSRFESVSEKLEFKKEKKTSPVIQDSSTFNELSNAICTQLKGTSTTSGSLIGFKNKTKS